MIEIFRHVDKFFTSLSNYLTYNYVFVIFVGLALLTALCVVGWTSGSYEARLIKAIDKFNTYFIDNPQITEENLVSFNAKMKSNNVPKQLRKEWQQFVLYREKKASEYMSFENCVSNPMKNSSFTRDMKTMTMLSWIFSLCSLILNAYYCFETNNIAVAVRNMLLTPVIILLINYIFQIFLNLRHSAIVSDLFQNYQYFEVNIDKATETLPEYVDYEVLFDRNEIKKGIPILYSYLQKRAEEEQRELEKARLRNVEHEKFNFDDQGVAASLVLERAMQEAENYIAERKKYNQDIAQINDDITQEDLNYREITKEYNRQMQVSKETFANFKAQLEEVSSTIEANYLKKQQQQELDRQRNLERDFDTATEQHKKVIESFQKELDNVDTFIAQSRKNLEDAMKSEFSTYSSKIYDEVKLLVEEREKEKYAKLKKNIVDLEEKLVAKDNQLDSAYKENQAMSEQLDSYNQAVVSNKKEKKSKKDQPKDGLVQQFETIEEPITYSEQEQNVQEEQVEDIANEVYDEHQQETSEELNYQFENDENLIEENQFEDEVFEEEYPQEEIAEQYPEEFYDDEYVEEFYDDEYVEEDYPEEFNEDENVNSLQNEVVNEEDSEETSLYDIVPEVKSKVNNSVSTEKIDDSIKTKSAKRGRPRKVVADEIQGEKKKRGRPRKEEVKTEPAKRPGRPKKEVVVETSTETKRKVGRPKKEEVETKPTGKRGRPRKVVADEIQGEKKKRGRPRKEEVKTEPAKRPGRPKKEVAVETVTETKRKVGRPKKENIEEQPKKSVGRPKKENTEAKPAGKRGRPRKEKVELDKPAGKRGRPSKQNNTNILNDIKDIDAYLKEIDDAIAAENAKLEETQKELAKKAKIRNKK